MSQALPGILAKTCILPDHRLGRPVNSSFLSSRNCMCKPGRATSRFLLAPACNTGTHMAEAAWEVPIAFVALNVKQASRQTEAEGLYEVLHNLWELLGIGEDDINRQLTSFAMKGPARLQTPMIDQVLHSPYLGAR